MSDTLYLVWHLGLGDAIICNGMVRELAKRHAKIVLPVKYRNVTSVFWMFSDLPNVFIDPVDNDFEMQENARPHKSLRLGLWSDGKIKDWAHWDEQLYRDAGVSFEQRWLGFRCPVIPRSGEIGECAFVHDDPVRGFRILEEPPIAIYRPFRTPHIFWHLWMLENCTEIHLIDSAFLCLAESIPLKSNRLVFHRYARPDGKPPTLRKRWEILQ